MIPSTNNNVENLDENYSILSELMTNYLSNESDKSDGCEGDEGDEGDECDKSDEGDEKLYIYEVYEDDLNYFEKNIKADSNNIEPAISTISDQINTTSKSDDTFIKTNSIIDEKDIFDTLPNPNFIQPIKNKESDNYIEKCNTLLKQLNMLTLSQNPITENIINDMTQNIEHIKNKMQQIIDIGKTFNKRDIMLCAFASTAQNILGTLPVTKGDFDRKYLECPRALEDLFNDNVFGNPIGSEINFVFTTIESSEIILYMDKLRQTTEKPIKSRLVFGSYRLDRVFNNPVIIRSEKENQPIRFTMIMTDIDSTPEISIRCNVSNDDDTADVRVQTIDYCGKHIFDALPDLVLRRVVHTENVTKYITKLTGTMTRDQRLVIWESILRVIEKDMQYLNQGYRYIDIGENKMIKISIEEKESCNITAINPPFTKIHLACNHDLSVMAIYGIVYAGKSEDTESIVCPMCRCTLIPKLVPALSDDDLSAFTVKTYNEKDIKMEIDVSEFNFEDNAPSLNIFKEYDEPNKFIDSLFEKKIFSDETESDDSDDSNNTENIIDDDTFMNYLGSMFRQQ